MNKIPLLTAIMLVTLTGTGLASREWRPVPEPPGVIEPQDMHLRYYEQIRSLLITTTVRMEKLCRGDGPGGER